MNIINDPIHGIIRLNDVEKRIISHPSFKRLMNIDQLGCASKIFPSATHKRYAHSIGVSYLGTKMMKIIQNNQPELGITNNDILMVSIAGLSHDLGHGPFSHAFESRTVKMISKKNNWTHENMSCKIIYKIINDLDIFDVDPKIIQAIILGQRTVMPCGKRFMAQIVNNEISGVDVDKFDYLMRDSFFVFGDIYKNTFENLIQSVRIIDDQLCFPNSSSFDIMNVFNIRSKLYDKVYTNNLVKAYEYMYADVIKYANPVFSFQNIINNVNKYNDLDDNIIIRIKYAKNTKNKLDKSHELINRIDNNDDIYRDICTINIPSDLTSNELVKINEEDFIHLFSDIDIITPDDIIISLFKIDFGKKDNNPLKYITWYDENDNTIINDSNNSQLTPSHPQDVFIRFYLKTSIKNEYFKSHNLAMYTAISNWQIKLFTKIVKEPIIFSIN